MKAAHQADGETLAAGRYDFDRLERSIEFLLEEHERLTTEREALLAELVDREHKIATLETRLEEIRGLLEQISDRHSAIDRELGQLEQQVVARWNIVGHIR